MIAELKRLSAALPHCRTAALPHCRTPSAKTNDDPPISWCCKNLIRCRGDGWKLYIEWENSFSPRFLRLLSCVHTVIERLVLIAMVGVLAGLVASVLPRMPASTDRAETAGRSS